MRSVSSLRSALSERNVLLLAVVRMAYSLSYTVFRNLFAIYAVQSLLFSPSLVSFLFSLIGLSTTLVRVPAGRVTDRMGAKRVLLFTYAIVVLDYVALAYVREPSWLTAALILFGLSSGVRAVAEWTYLTSTIPPEVRTISISFLFNCWDVGATVGSAISGFAYEILSFPAILLLAALLNGPLLPAILSLEDRKNQERSVDF